MNVRLVGETADRRGGRWQQVLFEATTVLVLGSLVALAANALSPRGLSLSRDYYPGIAPSPAPVTKVAIPVTNQQATATNVIPATNAVVARLRAHGLQAIEHDEVVAMFKDPRTAQDRFVFVDARNDKLYQEGHVPGALLLDYYHPEQYLALLLAASQMAEKIVVYCSGGDCDDSELTALLLGKVVPKERLFVYPGGFTQWSATGQPVELGARRSGVLKEGKR